MKFPIRCISLVLSLALSGLSPQAQAWGDEGHEIVARIAEQFLKPGVKREVERLLASDPSDLTAHDIGAEATWADRYRESDREQSGEHFRQTRAWHYANLDLRTADLKAACSPETAQNKLASQGAPDVCIVDKISQFTREWQSADTPPDERRLALKFLLHFIADIHQPLHAVNDGDAGGAAKRVLAKGYKPGKLHHYWDTEFVRKLGDDPGMVAEELFGNITKPQRKQWQTGGPTDWAWESFHLAKAVAYAGLPEPDSKGRYVLGPTYVHIAVETISEQLSKAGVRLAWVLNTMARAPTARK